jgi:HEAT repeat protein
MTEVEPINNNEKLRNILKGNNRSIPRTEAVSMLPLSEFPNKEEELRSVLENSNESDRIRHLAATSLGKIDTPKAKEILIEH